MSRTIFTAMLVVLFSVYLYAQKANRNRPLEIIPVQSERKTLSEKDYPSSLHNLSWSADAVSVEEIAWRYLKEQGQRLGISDAEHTLQYKKTRILPSGYRVRFRQIYKNYPVYKGGVVVSINNKKQVVFVANSYIPHIENNQPISITEKQAVQIAKDHLSLESKINYLKTDLVLYNNAGKSRLVRKINFIPQGKNVGDWEFLIDAETGKIIQAKDRGFYYGKVFDPDPITRSNADYGDNGFSDNSDKDSPQLNQQLVDRPLPGLTFENGHYHLQNEYAAIVDVELPQTGLFEQDSANFVFNRSQKGFEAVNAFYHISQSMSYINDTLGIGLMPYQYDGGVHFDPHGLEGEDNSWYTSAGYIAFGDGGVDDAEDQDVIIHELGHGIHDWITDGELSQVDGLSEGSSDYWAQSYKRSKGFMESSHPKYDWIASWDGHNSYWAGRITNYTAKYPTGLVDQIHTDGQIWASALMKIYDQIGREATDINFLNALSMLNENSSQRDAAYAFVQSDIDNYNGSHLQEIGEVFANTGYIENPLAIYVTADVTGGPASLTVTFNDIIDSHSSWQWDFDGDGITDSQERNPTYTYTEPGLYTVKLTISDGMETISDSLVDYISVNAGVFVWEGLKNGRDNSAGFIYEFLHVYGVPAVYSRSARIPSSLIGYDAVLLSFGAGSNGTTFTVAMKEVVEEYLKSGGHLYIEGADALSEHAGDMPFLDLLGISSVDEGKLSRTPVTDLAGQNGSIFKGIVFKESSQDEQGSIDTYQTSEDGVVAFVEGEYGNVAVQSDGVYGQKAVVFSYALTELTDDMVPNTRDDVLINILKYFDINLPLVPRFSANRYTGHAPLKISFSNNSIFDKTDPNLNWYWDFDNDNVYDSNEENSDFTFNTPGVYDVKLTAFNGQDSIIVIQRDFIHVFDGESALQFDENENYVEFEAQEELNLTQEFTITFRMCPTDWGISKNGFGRIFDKGNIQIYLRKLPAGIYRAHSLITYLRHQDGSSTTFSTPDSSVKLNVWYNVAISFSAVQEKLRILIASDSLAGQKFEIDVPNGPVNDNENTALVLAESLLRTRPYIGKLDEVRIWNDFRSFEQISQDMVQYVDPRREGLLAYWNFNEAWGDSLKDVTAKKINGRIVNPKWVESKPLPAEILTGIKAPVDNVVSMFRLYQNFPNPFNPQTIIKFQMPQAAQVELTIYDLLGRKVKSLIQSDLPAGVHSYLWNGTNTLNQKVASGIYFYTVKVKTKKGIIYRDQRKMVLIH